ncbi:N-6 DNA methylase [Edaphobacter paludis]|uniref:site-specific DNA-methyltransferase (adenine-specific) n=1 Tax=Edaphobacter paludis TaxID=3035702 RepID=A0AAU7DD53_9BACT
MARVRKSTLSFDAITLEGSLLSSAKFAAVAERKAEEQTDADYSIPKGLTLRDETARYFRIGQALFRELHASNTPARHKTIEFTEQLLRGVFGFSDIHTVKTSKFRDDRHFPVTLEALGGRVPVIVVPPSDSLDHASNSLSQDRRRSAASALQDWLNADEAALWGLCTNGESLRLLRDNESLTRPAYLEADLRQIFEAEDYAGFSALWLVLHASRFGRAGALPSDCPLERWRESGSKEGLAARDRLRDGVEAALLALGTGFLTSSANTELSARLREGTWPIDEYFRQLLRLVYKLIFLLAAEDRNLLHSPDASEDQRKLYAQGYSLGALRDRAIRRSGWDNFYDRWSGLRVTFRALANGEAHLGLPALGGIFATTATPELDRTQISNRFLMEAIFRLAWLRDDGLLMPVNWRDMETEELGSVYESLLELTPRLSSDGREFKFAEGAQTKGNARKTSGSYYTPDSLVQLLLDSALDPVLDRIESESEDPISGLLGVSVIDPACGSGHFLLAAARRIARRVVRLRCGDIHTEQDRLRALRDVVRSCIYGVDRNPMAVELTKVALWIETVEPGKPLGFLDANIRCGDSLLGVLDLSALDKGIPDAAFKPLTCDDKIIARDFSKKNKDEIKGQARLSFSASTEAPSMANLARTIRAARQLPEDTVAEIATKQDRYVAARHDPRLQNMAQAADLYIAAFLTAKTAETARSGPDSVIPTTADVEVAMRAGTVYGPRLGAARQIASEARAFHWPVEFLDILSNGGFDIVLGNPPWEVMQLGEEEYFAQYQPEIAELAGSARKRAIAALRGTAPAIFKAYENEKRRFEASGEFIRCSGRFDLTARGKVNTYSLFAEHFKNLAGKRGTAGIIVPTGIATDASTAPFFSSLVERRQLVQLIDFENRGGLFPAIDSRMKFCVLTVGHNVSLASFAFFLTDPSQLADKERCFTLSANQIERINPNTKNTPIFRSRFDAELTARIYERIPVLIDEGLGDIGNPWQISFRQGLFNMTSDSGLFVTAQQLCVIEGASPVANTWKIEGDPALDQPSVHYLPLYEAKMVSFFDHRAASYENRGEERGYRVLPPTHDTSHQNPSYEPIPFYWVSAAAVAERLVERTRTAPWLLGWKDITSSTNERTLIPALIPQAAVGDTFLLAFPQDKSATAGVQLVANWSSIVTDYATRQKIGGLHLKYNVFKQIPVLPPDAYGQEDNDFITPRVLELTYTSYSMAPFARDLGYNGDPFSWDEDRRALLRAELDAWYARAYGLSREELRYILDPADVMGADYPSETFRVLKNNEERKFGEYRTRRLILDAWDRMERGELHCPVAYDRRKAPKIDASASPVFALTPPKPLPHQPGLNFDGANSK